MDSSVRPEDVPYYSVEEDVEEYMKKIRKIADAVLTGVRARLDQLTEQIKAAGEEIDDKGTETRLFLEKQKQLRGQEEKLHAQLAEMVSNVFRFIIWQKILAELDFFQPFFSVEALSFKNHFRYFNE